MNLKYAIKFIKGICITVTFLLLTRKIKRICCTKCKINSKLNGNNVHGSPELWELRHTVFSPNTYNSIYRSHDSYFPISLSVPSHSSRMFFQENEASVTSSAGLRKQWLPYVKDGKCS